jgi:acyl-CoA reductase-like NAD-dependent aldehyde dehydrogenase
MKPFYLDGRWVETKTLEPVHNPWSGEKLGEVCMASPANVESAVAGAHAAFQKTRKIPAYERAEKIQAICQILAKRRQEFIDVIVAEAGKPLTFAEAEVDRARLTFQFAAALALADDGHAINMEASKPGAGHLGMVRRFPIGEILGITPFNFPLNLVAHKVAPCLATGNTMVLKPSPRTPLTALLLAEVLDEAGVPAGQIQILPFDHSLVAGLLTDPRIKMLSFTGSAEVGWQLKSRAAKMKVALELGGNAAVIVEPDGDWRAAIPKIASGAFGYAGQSCISVQRILVSREIFADFREALVSHIKDKVSAGDPTKRETLVGPMITPEAREKVLGWINAATAAGTEMLTPLVTEGCSLLGPVLLGNVPLGSAVLCEEAFAPLAVLQPYDTFAEALAIANDSRFGLQVGVLTNNLPKALQAYEELEVGGVMINQVPTFRVENMPYGGVKESGAGREGVRYAMEEMTEPRSLVINRL